VISSIHFVQICEVSFLHSKQFGSLEHDTQLPVLSTYRPFSPLSPLSSSSQVKQEGIELTSLHSRQPFSLHE